MSIIPKHIQNLVFASVGFAQNFLSSARGVSMNTAARAGQKIWGASLANSQILNVFKYILPIFLFCIQAHAAIEPYLKDVPNKSPIHSIRSIDYIYMINLDQRPEKWQKSLDQLQKYGITPHRFSAVNGWELTLDALNDVGLKYSFEMKKGLVGTCYPLVGNFEPSHQRIERFGQTYFCHCLSRGAIGVALSHLSILQDAFSAGYETIWIMEDDIEVLKNPHLLSDFVEHLDREVGRKKWDILFTDEDIRDGEGNHKRSYWAAERPDDAYFAKANNYALKQDVGNDFRRIGSRWGSHSMILSRTGIQKLLQFFYAHQIFFPYDMEYILPPGIQLYTVREDIVSNLPHAISDNGGPNYLN